MSTIGSWWMWGSFILFVIAMLGIDMFVLGGKKSHKVTNKEALIWVTVWILVAFVFNGLLWYYLRDTVGLEIANQKGLEFFTGYLIEKALSVDNMFVFIMLFTYFKIPPEQQRRVLMFGVLGAIILRCIMILAGSWLVSQFHWVLYLFGLFLVFTGVKMLIFADKESDLNNNMMLKWMSKHFRITNELIGEKFFIRQNKLLYITPLFVVLILVEISDVIFATDSIPAIFAITKDPFIVFTSNILAILGLRALYFLLANMVDKFYLLKYALAIILVFIGGKMLVAHWFVIPIGIALGIVAILLIVSVVFSLLVPQAQK